MPAESEAVQRILVALDASPTSLAALAAAVGLASSLGAELRGVFVEEALLLDLLRLPFAREVGTFSASVRELGEEELIRQLRAQARQARQALADAAESAGVRWSFDVLRGRVGSELVAAACEADLVTVGRGGWLPRASRFLGSTVERMLEEGCHRVLIHQGGRHIGRNVVVVHDGSARADAALATAELVARPQGAGLTVLVPGDSDRAVALQERLDESTPGSHVRPLRRSEPGAVVRAVGLEEAGLLVLPSSAEIAHREGLSRLLDGLDCPLLVVRG